MKPLAHDDEIDRGKVCEQDGGKGAVAVEKKDQAVACLEPLPNRDVREAKVVRSLRRMENIAAGLAATKTADTGLGEAARTCSLFAFSNSLALVVIHEMHDELMNDDVYVLRRESVRDNVWV